MPRNLCPNCETPVSSTVPGVLVCPVCTAALARRDGRIVLVPEAALPPEARATVRRQREALIDSMLTESKARVA